MELGELAALFAKILIVAGSVVVAFSPNVLYAAFALMAAFFGVAIFYVMAGADLLGGAQVIVYVGGILVVILFAIMLSHKIYHVPLSEQIKRAVVGLIAGSGIFAVLFHVLETVSWSDFIKPELPELKSSVQLLGNGLLKEFVFPFEAVSILLLMALVGGMLMSRPAGRDKRKDAT